MKSSLVFIIPVVLAVIFTACPGIDPAEPSYITEVFEYHYGPGQHAASIFEGDEWNFIGNNGTAVLLGGWGGYIIGGFDHVVVNGDGYDFAVFAQGGIGSEPGVVYVMQDTDGSGEPDEIWYELAGSETDADYSTDTGDFLDMYIRHYSITYHKAESDEANITWEDNQGNSGELVSGYPEDSMSSSWWMDEWGDELTMLGVKLPNVKYLSGSTWIDFENRFTEGYAENYNGLDIQSIDGSEANCFDISDAVDTDGNPVELEGIVFIKVQTGVFQQTGMLNEESTEISGAVDLSTVE